MDTRITNLWLNKPRIGFVAAWYGFSVTALTFAITFSLYLSITKQVAPQSNNFKIYSSLPQGGMEVSEDIQKVDARAKIIENFFRGYKAPLADFASEFIVVSDKYHLDWRLLPAIAMQESNGGRKVIENSNNPFGYGIYGGVVLKFASFEEAIERVGRGLRENYLDKGLKTPSQIMAKYTPPAIPTGSWAKGVSIFMEELQ